MANIPNELKSRLIDLGEFDYTTLEERTQENIDQMKERLDNLKACTKRPLKISFDIECQGLEKYKSPTIRLSKGTVAATPTLPLDHVGMTKMMEVLKEKLQSMESPFTRIAAIIPGIGHLSRTQAKHFPIIPPPGTQVLVIDSLSDLKLAVQALQEMGQAGIRGHEAVTNMRDAMLALSECGVGLKKKRKSFIKEEGGVLYSRGQAQRWPQTYSHKRPKKL